MKKNLIIILVVVFLILLIPIPLRLKDGGSIEYKALLYNVTRIHRLNEMSSTGYEDGWKVEILGVQIYNKTDIHVEVGKTYNFELIFESDTCLNCYNYFYEFEDGTKAYSSCRFVYKSKNLEIPLEEAIEKELITLSDLERHSGFKIVRSDEEKCIECC